MGTIVGMPAICPACPYAERRKATYHLTLEIEWNERERKEDAAGRLDCESYALKMHQLPEEWKRHWVSFSGKQSEFWGCEKCSTTRLQRKWFCHHPRGHYSNPFTS